MFEKNVIVQVGTDRNRKYAEIYCETQAELQSLDTGNYVTGTSAYIVSTAKTYSLDKPIGKWYDSSAAFLYGQNSLIGTITKTLTKTTATGATTAYYGNQVVIYLTADTGYDLPETIVVEIGEATGVADTDYIYDAETGIVTIPATKVTDAITITAVSTAQALGDIDFTLSNLTSTGDTTATYETIVEFTLVPATNYDLPATIEIGIGEAIGVVGTDYTYNATSGAVAIPAAKVVGAISVTAVGTGESQGDITYTVSNLTTAGDDEAFYGEDIDAVLVPAEGYDLPATIAITIGGVAKTVVTDYTYNAETGAVHIDGAKVTGAVVVTADGESET